MLGGSLRSWCRAASGVPRRRAGQQHAAARRRQRREERPADNSTDGIPSIDDRYVYQSLCDAQVTSFTQLLPNYMHLRFSDAMLVSPSRLPQDDVLERRDNYYVYLNRPT
jgi:hypothetical protein